jgi:hypothetical protein
MDLGGYILSLDPLHPLLPGHHEVISLALPQATCSDILPHHGLRNNKSKQPLTETVSQN